MMLQQLVILTLLLSTSAFAQVSQFYRSDGTSGMIFGSPNGIQQYYDSHGNTGTIFNNPQSGISQYYFMGPNGMMQDSGMIFSTPKPMPPVPRPAPQLQQMAPVQPWLPSMPVGRPSGR
jgi:hypothetical protein